MTAIESLCDGVIEMKTVEKGLRIENYIKIKKMVPASRLFRYLIESSGLKIVA